MKGKTFIIAGPSGVGKGTIIKTLFQQQDHLYFSVSATTRAPRPGEENGVHYHFISREQFQRWIEEDAFLEHAEYIGNCYGTPKKYVDEAMDRGDDVILDIEVQGSEQVHAKRPDTVRIFIVPPSLAELEHRLTGRGTERAEVVQERLRRAKEEFAYAKNYDYVVINNTLEEAVAEIRAIIRAEHCRTQERMDLIKGLE